MSEGKYAAVWWAKEKKWSVVEASTIVEGDKEAGCYAYALWNNVPYEVKILRTSDDVKMLSHLKVNSEGVVQIEKALLHSVSQPPKALKETKKKVARKETAAALPAVFLSKNSSDEEDIDDPDQDLHDLNNENRTMGVNNKTTRPVQVRGVSNKGSQTQPLTPSANNGMSWPQPPKEVVNYLFEVAHLLKDGNGNQLSKDELHSAKDTNQVDKTSRENKIARQSRPRATETSSPNRTRKRSPAPSSRLSTETPTSVATLNTSSGSGFELPFPTPEIADPCLLIPGFNVYVSKKRKNRIVKNYKSKPDAMMKELLLHILGEKNLKGMRARNHGSKSQYMPIPPHIMDAAETFVANYASSTLEKSKVTKCVNNFLQKLRDPSRDHHKSENSKRKKQDSRSDSGSSEDEGGNFETSKNIICVSTGPCSPRKSPCKVAQITPSAPLNASNHLPTKSPWKVNGVDGLTNNVATATRVLDFSSPPPTGNPQPPTANPQPPAANQPQDPGREQGYNHWQAPFQPQTFAAYSVPGAAFGYQAQHQYYGGTEPGQNMDSIAFPTYPNQFGPTYQSL